jgi:uncharacterized membrane protein
MNQKDRELDQLLIKLMQEQKPTNVQQLIKLTKTEKMFVTEHEILQRVLQLESQGRITLQELPMPMTTDLSAYLKKKEASWYWVTLVLATATAFAVLAIQENLSLLIYMRYILGAIFVVFLPGYALIKLLFPEKELDNIERIALSIALSLALVPMIGLILNYTPWGIRAVPLILSLLALTIILATAAIIRENQTKII